MEHFLPLAIASMVISLISIFLLDYFGPNTNKKPENESPADSKDFSEDRSLVVDKVADEETNMEMIAETSNPIWSAKSNNKNILRSLFQGEKDQTVRNIAYMN